MSSTQTLTCITCRLIFANPQEQKVHYKTELHQYNLQRKLNNEDPITEERFKTLQRQVEEKKLGEKEKKERRFCETCNRSFANENSYISHLTAKRHTSGQANKSTSETASQGTNQSEKKEESYYPKNDIPEEYQNLENLDEEEQMILEKIKHSPKLTQNDCLFCVHESKTVKKNLSHMEKNHSFWIPDQEYVPDISQLLLYLGQKISIGNTCLWCNSEFSSFQGVRSHMIAKCHCRLGINFDTHDEFTSFYDYSKDWETSKKLKDEDEEEEMNIESKVKIGDNGFDLILESGKTIGHRDLKKYYKQYWRPSFHPETLPHQKQKALEFGHGPTPLNEKQLSNYGVSKQLANIPQRQWKTMQKKVKKIEERKKLYDLKLGIKNNHLPKHKLIWENLI